MNQNSLFHRALMYGVYKVTFFSRMWDEDDEDPNWTRQLPFEGEAYTYIEVLPSALIPNLLEGALTYVTRGTGQFLNMVPKEFSLDPDFPDDKVRLGNVPVHSAWITKNSFLHTTFF